METLAEQLQEDGLFVRIIARPIPSDRYEILSGHNRVAAAKLAGWAAIPAEVVEADDTRAIVIATSTNLIQRQGLSIIERGKAYKALLDAKNCQGLLSDRSNRTSGDNRQKFGTEAGEVTSGDNRQKFGTEAGEVTSGESRQKYSARALVAEFFGITEYEIRKAIKLAQLIPGLADILESNPKQLNLAWADLMADYDAESQKTFIEMCSVEGFLMTKSIMQHIARKCPPPTADQQEVYAACREARNATVKRLTAPPKKISFNRKQFAPYLDKLGSDREIEKLFLECLKEKYQARTNV